MGLDYLNKKIWHPGSMKNIQKVWQEQQKQKQINKKTRQRAKKLLQQQHNEDLKRIQVEAGLIPRSHLDRMDWMYDWGNKIGQNKTNQQYLTGKKTAYPGQKKQPKHIFQQQITNKRCQDFQLLHEDPLFQIMKKQKQQRDAMMNNPIQMKNIIKQVEKQYMPQDYHYRKKMASQKRRVSSSSSSSSSRSKQRSRSRSRSNQNNKHKKYDRQRERSNSKGTSDKSYKQSKVYQQYLQQRFSGMLKKDQLGNLKPDYSIHKSKYRTQMQKSEDQRKRLFQKMQENAKKLQKLRNSKNREQFSEEQQRNYEQGVATIRKSMFEGVKQNRNHKKYRQQSD